MSYNGSGTFNINTTGQPVVAGTVITASVFNALTADLATGLTTAITKDGQTTTTARITFAQGITSSLVTDSSSVSTGSIITAGGVGIAKALYVGTTANVAGAVTLGGIATFSAQPIFSSLTASSAVATDASKGLVSVTNTGTGNNVLATSPTITTPTISSLSSAAATALTLQSAGTTAITVDTSQNVGIGTSSPGQKVDISTSGDIQARIGNSVTGAQFTYDIGRVASSGLLQFYGNQSGATGYIFSGINGERMRIDSSGNVMIGTTTIGAGNRMNVVGNNVVFSPNTAGKDTHTFSTGAADVGTYGIKSDTTIKVFLNAGGDSYFTGGNLLVGATSAGGNGFVLYPNYDATNCASIDIGHITGSVSGNRYARFQYAGGTIGSITQNGTTGVLYNLTSDYRLKNNPVALTGAKDFVMALQPKTWDWWDNSGKGVGFIAHEFMEVAKYSGHGEKDAVDADGKPIHQSIQPSSSEVMANIVALMQEQQATITAQAETINALTARIVALESK
jgi:hypothetical protein